MYKDYKGKTSKENYPRNVHASERDMSIGGIEFHSLGIRLK